MATVVVWSPRGAWIDGMNENGRQFSSLTQTLPSGGVANTGGTVRVTSNPTEIVGTHKRTWTVSQNGV